jgi:hypothetical protein
MNVQLHVGMPIACLFLLITHEIGFLEVKLVLDRPRTSRVMQENVYNLSCKKWIVQTYTFLLVF